MERITILTPPRSEIQATTSTQLAENTHQNQETNLSEQGQNDANELQFKQFFGEDTDVSEFFAPTKELELTLTSFDQEKPPVTTGEISASTSKQFPLSDKFNKLWDRYSNNNLSKHKGKGKEISTSTSPESPINAIDEMPAFNDQTDLPNVEGKGKGKEISTSTSPESPINAIDEIPAFNDQTDLPNVESKGKGKEISTSISPESSINAIDEIPAFNDQTGLQNVRGDIASEPIEMQVKPPIQSERLTFPDQNQETNPSDQGKKSSTKEGLMTFFSLPPIERRLVKSPPWEKKITGRLNNSQGSFVEKISPATAQEDLSNKIEEIPAFENIRKSIDPPNVEGKGKEISTSTSPESPINAIDEIPASQDQTDLQNLEGDGLVQDVNRDIQEQRLELHTTIAELANEIPNEYTGREALSQAESNYELLREATARGLAYHAIHDSPTNRDAFKIIQEELDPDKNNLDDTIAAHLPDTPFRRELTILYDAQIRDDFQAVKQHLEWSTFDRLIKNVNPGKGNEIENSHTVAQLKNSLDKTRKMADELGQIYQKYYTAAKKFTEYNKEVVECMAKKLVADQMTEKSAMGIETNENMQGAYWPYTKSFDAFLSTLKEIKWPTPIRYESLQVDPYIRREHQLNGPEQLVVTEAKNNAIVAPRPDEIQPVTSANTELPPYQKKLKSAMESIKSEYVKDIFSPNTIPNTYNELKFVVKEFQRTLSEVEKSLNTIIEAYKTDSPATDFPASNFEKLTEELAGINKLATKQTEKFTTDGKKIYTRLAEQLTKQQRDIGLDMISEENTRIIELVSLARDAASSSKSSFRIFLKNQWQNTSFIQIVLTVALTSAVAVGVGVGVGEINKAKAS